jgi:hypothetical protein
MNRRKLLLTTAKTALLTAFGMVTGARAQTPIESRTVLPIPQELAKSPRRSMRAMHVRRRSVPCARHRALPTSSSY